MSQRDTWYLSARGGRDHLGDRGEAGGGSRARAAPVLMGATLSILDGWCHPSTDLTVRPQRCVNAENAKGGTH